MSLRRIALALVIPVPLVAGVAAYVASLRPVSRRPTGPSPPRRIDLNESVELKVEGMAGLKALSDRNGTLNRYIAEQNKGDHRI